MATADNAARSARANDFAADYAAGTLTILDGATTLAVHTLAGFPVTSNGVLTANAIADATIAADGTADSATLSDGSGLYTLTVGATGSGADIEISTLTFITGETSSITSLSVTFPA